VPKVIDGLKEYDAFEGTLVLVGGIISEEDRDDLREMGVAEIFGPGAPIEETIQFIRDDAPDR